MTPNKLFSHAALFLVAFLLTQHKVSTYDSALVENYDAIGKRSVDEREVHVDVLDGEDVSLEKRRNKRWVGTLIMTTSMVVQLGSIGFEAYGALQGCCGNVFLKDYKACDNRKRIVEVLIPRMKNTSRQIDYQYLHARNELEYVTQNNFNNRAIWGSIKRLSGMTQDLVTLMDPDIVKAMEAKKLEIKKAVAAKNATLLKITLEQLSTQFDSLFHTAFGTARAVGGILGYGFYYAAAYAYTEYKVNQIAKTLDTKYGKMLRNAAPKSQKLLGFTDKNIQKHLKETARNQYNQKLSTSKVAKFISAASYLWTTVGIGFQIWSAIKKIQDCKDKETKTETALKNAEQANKDFNELLKNVTAYRAFVATNGTKFVKDQVTSEEFTNVLKGIASVAQKGSKHSTALRKATNTINYFIANVKAADQKTMYTLGRQLIKALNIPLELYSCYSDKVRVINYIREGCKVGSHSLPTLYRNGVQSFPNFNSVTCRQKYNVPTTMFAGIDKIVSGLMAKAKLQADCILNSKSKKKTACFLMDSQGLSAVDVSLKMKITRHQAAFFLRNCPARSLTRKEKKQICVLRGSGLKADNIAKTFFQFKNPQMIAQVVAFYNVCPLTKEDKKKVCKLRAFVNSNETAQILSLNLNLVSAVKCA